MEKEKDRSFKDLQLIKQQIKFKESDVKSEMERVWSEWQEKHDFLEEELANLKQRLQTQEVEKKKIQKENLEVKKENRLLDAQVKDKESQIAII